MTTDIRFEPYTKYQESDIERIAGPPNKIKMSLYTVWSVLIENTQYDFLPFAFADGDALVLIAVDGRMPQPSHHQEEQ